MEQAAGIHLAPPAVVGKVAGIAGDIVAVAGIVVDTAAGAGMAGCS